MKRQQVHELMVPISDYATIHKDATIAEAIKALENENKQHAGGPYRHQSLVVVDGNNHVVGRLSQVDMMRAMEPRYNKLGDARWTHQTTLTKEVLVALRESFQLWEQSLEEACREIGNAKVSDYIQEPTEGEFVSETDTMNIAMHRTVMGRHHSLLVIRDKEIIGILRSTDLFNALCDRLDACPVVT